MGRIYLTRIVDTRNQYKTTQYKNFRNKCFFNFMQLIKIYF